MTTRSDGTSTPREKTCCDDCNMQCGEHNIRWGSVEKLERDHDELCRNIEQRRTDIDKKLEVGVAKFASLENSLKIFMAVIALMFTVASIGYSKATNIENNFNKHVAEDTSEFKALKGHLDFHNASVTGERQQEEEIHNLSEITKVTKETLKAIEQRLERIEKKI